MVLPPEGGDKCGAFGAGWWGKNYPAVLAGLFGLSAVGLLCRLPGFKAGFTSGKFKLGAV